MLNHTLNIIPISKARGKLGDLVQHARGENYVILTKGGEPRAALVDFKYLLNLEQTVKKFYQKTFIEPKLIPYTREFTDPEIARWLKEDQL